MELLFSCYLGLEFASKFELPYKLKVTFIYLQTTIMAKILKFNSQINLVNYLIFHIKDIQIKILSKLP